MSGCVVCYVWLLPLLSKIDLVKASDSISAFIANPPQPQWRQYHLFL